ncbi:hypothetical protein MJT46_011850 [Ovis ammon polii x Ovis aries]|nr:hypothetical protein MJT46_011850 [Ovis ammon polii x Ovis aries]
MWAEGESEGLHTLGIVVVVCSSLKLLHYLGLIDLSDGIWERSPQTSNSPYGQPPLLLRGTPPPLLYLKLFHLYDKQEGNQDLLSSNQENAFCGQKPF